MAKQAEIPTRLIQNSYKGLDVPRPYSVIIPAFNEERGVHFVLDELTRTLPQNYELIVIDDGSTDDTVRSAREFPCTIFSHIDNEGSVRNYGKGAALKTGFRESNGKYLTWIDADGTYPADQIPVLVEMLEGESYDLVYAKRSMENIPPFNRLGNIIARQLMRYVHSCIIDDPCSGLCGGREWLKHETFHSDDFGIEVEIAAKAAKKRLQIGNLPIIYGERIGESKLHPIQDGFRIAQRIVQEKFN